jgi:hypothetical protein
MASWARLESPLSQQGLHVLLGARAVPSRGGCRSSGWPSQHVASLVDGLLDDHAYGAEVGDRLGDRGEQGRVLLRGEQRSTHALAGAHRRGHLEQLGGREHLAA